MRRHGVFTLGVAVVLALGGQSLTGRAAQTHSAGRHKRSR